MTDQLKDTVVFRRDPTLLDRICWAMADEYIAPIHYSLQAEDAVREIVAWLQGRGFRKAADALEHELNG